MPEIGRFTSPDTLVPDPSNPQSYNRYSYALNNPVNYTDPTGHMPASGCGYEACSLPLGLNSGATWQSSDGVLTPWDPVAASAQDYNPVTQAAIPGAVGIVGVAVAPALAGAVAELAGAAVGSATTAACADGDCTNETQNLLKLRDAYEQEVRALGQEAQQRLASGQSPEQVAHWAHSARRALGVTYKNLTPGEILEEIYARNLQKYKDPLGPSIEYLVKVSEKSWLEIIESATRPGGADIIPGIIERLQK